MMVVDVSHNLGRYLLSGGLEFVLLIDWQTSEVVGELTLHDEHHSEVSSLLSLPSHVLVGYMNGMVAYFELDHPGELVHRFWVHKGEVTSLAASRELVASGSADCSIALYDPLAGVVLKKLKGHTNGVISLGFNSALELVSVGRDSLIKVSELTKVLEHRGGQMCGHALLTPEECNRSRVSRSPTWAVGGRVCGDQATWCVSHGEERDKHGRRDKEEERGEGHSPSLL